MAIVSLLGSGEFQPWVARAERWCIERSAGESARVLVAPVASAPEGEDTFRRWADMGLTHYRSLGLEPEVLEVRTRDDADDPAIAELVPGARLIFFSGGNPGYLADTLRDTHLWRTIARASSEGVAIGGCSAGACALGTRTFWTEEDRITRWVDGLGLLARAFVLPHFDALEGWEPGIRRKMFVHRPAGSTIVGLDEQTALYGSDGSWRVAGAGAAWIGERAVDLNAFRDGDEAVARLGFP